MGVQAVKYSDQNRAVIVLQVMMHVYSRAHAFGDYIPESEARRAALQYLLEAECIEFDHKSPCGYSETSKGSAWVERLLELSPNDHAS
jgi:hypothetical protein